MATISRDPWQTLTTNNITIPASKSLEAAEVFQGFMGSWAAEYVNQPGMMDQFSSVEGNPAPVYKMSSHIGQPGYPEINFVPYSHGTNRFGPKGGSLLGCPISFSVIGPTLKRGGKTNWQWVVTDNSAGAGGDTLTIDSFTVDFSVNPPVSLGGATDIQDVYKIGSMSDCIDGLYLVITHTGHAGSLFSGGVVDGGVGDGDIWQFADGHTRYALAPVAPESKYEIFRVMNISGDTLTLSSTKRLKDYFTFTAAAPGVVNVVRGIMLFEPKATRLVAVPDSGTAKGLEQTFAVVPPLRAANDDQQYPFLEWATNLLEEGWYGAMATANGAMDDYSLFEYRNPPQLPAEKPIGQTTLRLYGMAGEGVLPDFGPGRFLVKTTTVPGWGTTYPVVGDLIKINNVRVIGDVSLMDVTSGLVVRKPKLESLLGWFEVVREPGAGAPYPIILRRVSEVDPVTGRSFLGTTRLLQLDQTVVPSAGESIELDCTIHHPISSLWTSNYYDVDAVEASRLTNLIDPSWTGRSLKGMGNSLLARADKAIFDTTLSPMGFPANPGSLLDLGFRMVLFPAISRSIDIPNPTHSNASPWHEAYQSVDQLRPDFDQPVDSNEILLDPSKPNEKQYVMVDYANGLVRFSHPIKVGSPLYNSGVFNHVDNPRNEMVIFASCVPYSREPGQLGAGIRATGGQPVNSVDVPCFPQGTERDSSDVYGARTVIPLYFAVTNTLDPTRNDPTTSIIFQGMSELNLPSAGFVEILDGVSADGEPSFYGNTYRGSLFGYYALLEDTAASTVTLFGRYGGSVPASTKSYDFNNPGVAVLRKEIILPNTQDGVAGVPYQYDVTYGNAKRSGTVRFGDSELTNNPDGSLTVTPRATIAKSIQDTLGDVLSSEVLSGGFVVAASTSATVEPLVYLIDGVRKTVPGGTVTFTRGGSPLVRYVVWDDSTCAATLLTTIPQASSQILLAKLDIPVAGPAPTLVTDLRYPLIDVDARTDIIVGGPSGFTTIAKAVAYVNELMNPTGLPGSTPSQNMKIKVVASTAETETPIFVKTDGLTIEGVGIREDGYGVTSWSGNGALFDINGHNGTVIRNLVSVNSSTTFAGKSTVTATGTHGATPGSIEVYTHEPVPAAYIKITAAANVIALQSGVADTVQLTATTYGHAPETYTWVSADAGIATVDGIGLVTSAAGSGRVVISAIGNTTGVIGEFLIQVWTGAMGHIVVVGGQFIVRDGDTATVIAQTINGAADASYAWVSSYLPAVTVTTPGATTTATGHAEQPRCMITNTGSPAIGCVIEHCLAITEPGATHQHGLLYVPSSSGLIGSRITDCFASTSAFGVFIEGVAAQLDITDNWIQCSSTYPARDGGFRLPHVGGGIVVDSASVLGLYIHNNHVQDFGGFFISPLYDTSYDVYSSQAAFIQNNVLTGNTPWVKSGISSVVTNNSLSGTGLTKIDVDAGGTTPSLCTVAGNTVTSSGHLGTIDSGIGTTLSDNKTDLITLNSNCRATGNYLYYGFGFPMGSVTAVQIVGNNLGNPAGFSISAASSSLYDSVIDGNTMAGAISIGGGNYTVANNIVELGMTLGGASTVTGNQVTGAVLFDCGTAGAVVTGNMFGNNVTFSTASTACENVRFGDNTVLGGLGMADGGGGNVQMKHTVTGNDIVGAANIDASDSTITGNKFRGAVTIGTTTARADDTVAGNRIEGALTVGVGCMVTGNIGNSTTDITVSAGCTVIGNTFRNLLPVMGDPEPGGGKTPVLGNRILGSRFGVAGPFVGDYLGNQS